MLTDIEPVYSVTCNYIPNTCVPLNENDGAHINTELLLLPV